jgi:hypothetical protein
LIIQQCTSCCAKGKNFHCNKCLKSPDFFDIYEYNDIKNRFDRGRLKWRIKAYTWHDATEYVKDSFFSDVKEQELNINCEKDFAYIEWNSYQIRSDSIRERQRIFRGYKIYLNKELNRLQPSSLSKDQNFSDLTIWSSNLINNDDRNI